MPQIACALELKSISEQGEFEGKASVYNVVDEGDDLVVPGAFTKTLSSSQERPLYWEHKEIIGTVELRDSPSALLVKGRLSLGVRRADEALILLRTKAVKGLSIGYKNIQSDFQGTVRRLKELALWEVSLTGLPMNRQAVVTAVKAADIARLSREIQEFRDGIFAALKG